MIEATCPTCSAVFSSRKAKRFCSLPCYLASPEFKEKAAANGKKRAGKVGDRKGEMGNCLHCNTSIYIPPQYKNRPRKRYCNAACYRAYMADRFDRHVASDTPVEMPQCYDEFRSADVLPCLVQGCNWVGHRLAMHMNMAHGITAAQAKEMGGFVRSAGLVSRIEYQRLSAVQKDANRIYPGRLSVGSSGKGPKGIPRRPEAVEHQKKARAS